VVPGRCARQLQVTPGPSPPTSRSRAPCPCAPPCAPGASERRSARLAGAGNQRMGSGCLRVGWDWEVAQRRPLDQWTPYDGEGPVRV
jgi:hypothetical protein